MEKPISIRAEELKNNLIKNINDCELIPIIIEPIVKEIYDEIKILKKQQYEKDKKIYENSMKDDSKESEEGK